MQKYMKLPWYLVFDDKGDGSGDDAAAKAAADAAAKAAADAASKGGFTQEQVNKILAEDRRKNQEKTKKVIEELEALKSKATLTQTERSDLENRLETMRNELLTKEELAKKEQHKITQKYTEDIKKATSERDTWQQRFTVSTIQRSITDAAASNNAYNARQIVAILEPTTKMVEALDKDGQPTGEYVPKVTFKDVDKDGKPVTLDLEVSEAVKRMSEMDEFANLFKASGTGGTGGGVNRGGKGKPLDARQIAATDPAEYRRLRKEGKI